MPTPDSDDLSIDASRSIPRSELTVRASRAGGPGGQHVNTSSTRVEVVWNPARSQVLTPDEQARLASKLASRLDAAGDLRVVASDTRSQRQNREVAEQRLAELVRRALVVPKQRKATKPSRAAKARRLDEKKHDSRKKRDRRSDSWD